VSDIDNGVVDSLKALDPDGRLEKSGEKRAPASDIDNGVVDSLKALDPEWPIREADISPLSAISGPMHRKKNVSDQFIRSPRRRW